jgi:hypothetical protein
MQIVWDSEVVEKLKNSHTLLELETFPVGDKTLTAWCVIPVEKVFAAGFETLEFYKSLHADFVTALKANDKDACLGLANQLMGQFGGEMDSFYEIIIKRLTS